MMEYLRSVVADIEQWSLVCHAAVAFCAFVIGLTAGAFLMEGELDA